MKRPSHLRRLKAGFGTVLVASSLMVAAPTMASAQPVVPGSSAGFDLGAGLAQLRGQVRSSAWQTRTNLVNQARAALPSPQADAVQQMLDSLVEALFPGISAEHTWHAPVPAADGFDRGPCPTWADVCVDLNGDRSWLQENGQVVYVAASSAGAPSPETATPTGLFHVEYKVKDEVSRAFNNAPMPNSVYFTRNGHAFHGGDVGVWSHGCVHLNDQDSLVFFNTLQPGDTVFIY